jgi:hypothetical protein
MSDTQSVLGEVRDERSSQDRKHGQGHDDEHGVNHLVDETYKHLQAVKGSPADRDPAEVRRELIIVAALAVAAVETHDRAHSDPVKVYPPGDTVPAQ